MELRSREFLDQFNTYNLCSLNTVLMVDRFFTFRKCPSHICNDFSFNCANAFDWMRHTLNWLKWSCSRKAKTAPEHLLEMFYIPHWNLQDLITRTLSNHDKSAVLPLNEKITFIWKQLFFPVFYNPICMFIARYYLAFFIFWVRSCFLVVS